MKIVDSGVVNPSFMDFTLPSHFCTSALYRVPQFGHFYCNENYCIDRGPLNLFLFIYVCSGSLFFEMEGKGSVALRDQIILLDCRKPHKYYCSEPTEFLWFHFNGNNSEQYTEYLYEQNGPLFSGETVNDLRRSFQMIFSYSQEVPSNEHLTSMHVGRILSRLAAPERRTSGNRALDPAIDYIREHYNTPIALEDLAAQCNMSTSHFIRSFGKYLNRTPHEYLLSYRLRQSKQMLLSSQDSIEQIAEQCGFNSASHFARAFRKSNGISPSEFRSITF